MKLTSATRLVITLLFVIFALPPQAASAEQASSATVEAATQLTEWFSKLLRPFQEISETAEKQYLVDALVDLNRSLFDVEQDKRYVVIALRRRPLVQAELQRASDSLTSKIAVLRESLIELAPRLRIAYRPGADEAIDLLSEAISMRKGFVYNLEQVTEVTADRDIDDAQAAIQALGQAQRKLADVIAALQKS